ncbi:hypothetical protein J4401_06165 [Candidatus Woesearchaeota archaeon]|nr:hypothetical protein [Candidatus Woesearchaeota archaeon]
MANRKKRLQKGIESIERQIKIHEEKLEKSQKEGNIALAGYYEKEISAKKKDKEEKQRILKKGG